MMKQKIISEFINSNLWGVLESICGFDSIEEFYKSMEGWDSLGEWLEEEYSVEDKECVSENILLIANFFKYFKKDEICIKVFCDEDGITLNSTIGYKNIQVFQGYDYDEIIIFCSNEEFTLLE